jgi:hypothetical protein
MSNVKIVKLVSGEEIIGKVIEAPQTLTSSQVQGSPLVIQKPAAILLDPRGKMALVDYVPMADKKEITLKAENVMFVYDPVIEVTNAYQKSFGSGIIAASSNILTSLG